MAMASSLKINGSHLNTTGAANGDLIFGSGALPEQPPPPRCSTPNRPPKLTELKRQMAEEQQEPSPTELKSMLTMTSAAEIQLCAEPLLHVSSSFFEPTNHQSCLLQTDARDANERNHYAFVAKNNFKNAASGADEMSQQVSAVVNGNFDYSTRIGSSSKLNGEDVNVAHDNIENGQNDGDYHRQSPHQQQKFLLLCSSSSNENDYDDMEVDGTPLNQRSLSSPELLQLPSAAAGATMYLSSCRSSSGMPSPLPIGDIISACVEGSTIHQLPPTPSSMRNSSLPTTTTTTHGRCLGLSKTSSPLPPELLQSLDRLPTARTLAARYEQQQKQQQQQTTGGAGGWLLPSSWKTQAQTAHQLDRPKVQLNGASILSIVGADHLLDSAQRLMMMSHGKPSSSPSPTLSNAHATIPSNLELRRRSSTSTEQSAESKRNLTILKTIQRTHNQLKRTRLWHAFYLFALPVYTIIGAILFQALDGANSDRLMSQFEQRCRSGREYRLHELRTLCVNSTTTASLCFELMSRFVEEVEQCYRRWHSVNRTMTHPMSDFTNAIIYAFSVYTTIGYGTISPSSTMARIATVIYGAFGIPLFFAFVKEEGNQCRTCFVWFYNRIKKWYKARRRVKKETPPASSTTTYRSLRPQKVAEKTALLYRTRPKESSVETITDAKTPVNKPKHPDQPSDLPQIVSSKCQRFKPFVRRCSDISLLKGMTGGNARQDSSHPQERSSFAVTIEQRRVFFCGVLVFIIYLLLVSFLFTRMTDWDFWTAFYFLFNSVALIGFGDVFPSQSRIILVNMFFIVTGVVLFSMCYFILQEEIRVKAFEASRKARMSICKYSQSLMLHTRPIANWSRRNSPNFDDMSAGSAFERLRKRRQSAPVITIDRVGSSSRHQQRKKSTSSPSPSPSATLAPSPSPS